MSKTATNYVPGVCNINQDEIKQRRAAGHIGLVVSAVLLGALLALDLSRWYRLIIFLPALLMTIGYLQARNKFCVGYADAGMHHADDDSEVSKVLAKQAAKDKKRSSQIKQQAVGLAILTTLVALLIP